MSPPTGWCNSRSASATNRRRHPAQGHDGAISASPDPSREGGRDHRVPCRGGRGRPDRLPMGQASWRHRDRHHHLAHKVELAKANGCTHVLNSKDAGWEKQVRELTGGAGVPVVYDSIGKDTFLAGLDCLAAARHHGDLRQFLRPRRSLLAVNPGGQGLAFCHPANPGALHPHAAGASGYRQRSVRGDSSGAVKVAINQRFALKDAAQAHDALTGKQTTGATILIP